MLRAGETDVPLPDIIKEVKILISFQRSTKYFIGSEHLVWGDFD